MTFVSYHRPLRFVALLAAFSVFACVRYVDKSVCGREAATEAMSRSVNAMSAQVGDSSMPCAPFSDLAQCRRQWLTLTAHRRSLVDSSDFERSTIRIGIETYRYPGRYDPVTRFIQLGIYRDKLDLLIARDRKRREQIFQDLQQAERDFARAIRSGCTVRCEALWRLMTMLEIDLRLMDDAERKTETVLALDDRADALADLRRTLDDARKREAGWKTSAKALGLTCPD